MRPLPEWLRRSIRDGGAGLTVLVVRLGAMGDILRTLPPVRLVRFALPDARLVWLCWDRWAELLEGHPDLDEVVTFPRRDLAREIRSLGGLAGAAMRLRRFASRLRGVHPSLVLDFHGNLRSGVMGVWSGADVRLGFDGHQQREGNRFLSTHRVGAGARRTPRMERNLALIRALGIPDRPLPGGGLPIDAAAERRVAEIVASCATGAERYAILSPGASRLQAYKKPPATLLGAAAAELRSQGIAPIVIWGPGEEEDARRVVEASRGSASMSPPTSLRDLAALISEAEVFVGGDTGPMHLACAVDCRVVALYGPTDPQVNAPWRVPNVALHPPGRVYTGIKRKDREGGGFEGLDPSAVAEAVRRIVAT